MSHSLPLYATIDLGSNSFHMLILQQDPTLQEPSKAKIIAKLKRKVRLAAGLNNKNQLSEETIQQGLACLSWFAQTLNKFKPEHCCIIGTATLRRATNAQDFVTRGEKILQRPIHVITGIEEASLIYQGASSSSGLNGRQLVIDIGGASTEIIIGKDSVPIELASLDIGCVTWLEQFFGDKKITNSRFNLAIRAAEKQVATLRSTYLSHGWDACIGASGTIQTISKLARERNVSAINLPFLQQLRAELVSCGHISNLTQLGLPADRALVFPSGLAILIAIFVQLEITEIQIASGALREGILFTLLNPART